MTPTSSRAPGGPAPDAVRHQPGALADAITRGWRPFRWRGYLVGALAGMLVGGVLAPIMTTVVALGLDLAGVGVDPRLPWAEIVWSAAFVVTFAAVGAWAVARWLPSPFRDALETYVWLAVEAETRWRRAFGDRPVPRSASALRSFVDATPETPETAAERLAAWLALGDLDAARRVFVHMPADTEVEPHSMDASVSIV